MASPHSTRLGNVVIHHARAVRPLDFPSSEPESERLGETKRHLELRTFVYQLLKSAFAPEHTIGSDQFVYWNGRDPQRKCAPDAFVKIGVPDREFDVWKTWLCGAPELVVEILSRHDREPFTWAEKMKRFAELGAMEVVRFDVDARPGKRLSAWDRVEDDLVRRSVSHDATPCRTLGLHWVIASAPELSSALRLARDAAGRDLLLHPIEAAESARRSAEAAQRSAEARVAELEAELRKRGGA